jgi:cyclomaltodextrinase
MRPAAAQPLESDFQPFGPGNVRPHRIEFDSRDPAYLSRDAHGILTFRVVAPAETLEAMVVVRGETIAGYPMRRVGAAGGVSLWDARIAPSDVQLRFSLAIRLEGDLAAYLAPTGVASGIERIDRFELHVDEIAVHDAPPWAAGALIYQIFPDRFARSSASGPNPGLDAWDVAPTSRSFLGGDLPGVVERLPHLVDLGVDVVYLNPVFTSPSNHGYDTVDYRAVDPALGGDEALRTLVAAAHDAGLRVILDTSLNHCHPKFFAFADLVERGPGSVYAGWFDVHEWPVRVRCRPHLVEPDSYWGVHLDRLREESGMPVEAVADNGPVVEPTYDAWYGVPLMPRVNLEHPDARRYMLDTATYWVREFDVDGWRMDVVRYIDHDFWHEMRREVRAVRADAYLLAEVMGDARRWLAGDEFDAVMNYTFRELAVDYFATRVIDTAKFLEGLLEMTAMYSPAVTAMNHNLLGSHDTPRFLTLAGGDEVSLLLATLVQLTVPGSPGIYYGDEIGMVGGPDPDNRRGMTWSIADSEVADAVRSLAGVRKEHAALRTGSWSLVSAVGDAFAYERVLGGGRVVVVVNTDDEDDLLLPPLGVGSIEWSVGAVVVSSGGVRVGPRSGGILT